MFNFFFRKFKSYEIMWNNKVSQKIHRWKCNMAQALCMLDKKGYRYALRIHSMYCFSLAT